MPDIVKSKNGYSLLTDNNEDMSIIRADDPQPIVTFGSLYFKDEIEAIYERLTN